MWSGLVTFVTVGYFSLARTFAYIGIAPAKLFIGELALGMFLVAKPRVALGMWITALMRPSPINLFALTQYLFVMLGIVQALRGVFEGAGVDVVKYFVFNYYTFYVYLGLWVAVRDPSLLPRILHIVAWINGAYGLAYLIVLKSIPLTMFGAPNVSLFGQPNGSAVAILGLLCFERNLSRVWYLLVVNIIVLLGMSVRAEWLGLGLATLVWGLLTGKAGRVLLMGVAAIGVVGLVELADLDIAGRGKIDTGLIISRAIAPFDRDLAAEFSPYAAEDGGTLEWRMSWWRQIWASAQSEAVLELFGHGYGFDLFSLAPPSVRAGQEHENVRTPHNVFYFALGYTGWIGVILFGSLQLAILRTEWIAYRISGQPFGMMWWIAGMCIAFFSNFFETPFQSIPFYLIMGMSMAPLFRIAEDDRLVPAKPTKRRRIFRSGRSVLRER
jgi:hypothetical protein